MVSQLNAGVSILGGVAMSSLGVWSGTTKLIFTSIDDKIYTISASGNLAMITGILDTPTSVLG